MGQPLGTGVGDIGAANVRPLAARPAAA